MNERTKNRKEKKKKRKKKREKKKEKKEYIFSYNNNKIIKQYKYKPLKKIIHSSP
jgi:hypothetical protein